MTGDRGAIPDGGVYTHHTRRALLRRRRSPFKIMLALFGLAVAIVLYISNIIAVDQLLRDIGELDERHRQIAAQQEYLRAQINRLSGIERIQQLAEHQLSLRAPQAPPVWLTVDTSRIRTLEQPEP